MLSDKNFFHSFNCFNNSLGTLLSDYIKWGLSLSLHSRWQFFYSKSWSYDNDNRFTGEYPYPYDIRTFNLIGKIFGGQIKIFEKKVNTLSDLLVELFNNNKFIVFVNKYFLDKSNGEEKPTDVLTTVIVDGYDVMGHKLHYYNSDDNFSSHWIDENRFFLACKYAPHEFKINGLLFNVMFQYLNTGQVLEEKRNNMAKIAVNAIIAEADIFISGSRVRSTLYGADAIRYFAEDIVTWPDHPMICGTKDNTLIFKRLIDCAVYLVYVKKQREAFTSALVEISDALPQTSKYLPNWINNLEDISKKWMYLKLMLFLAGERQQLGNLKNISMEIHNLRECEVGFLESLKEGLEMESDAWEGDFHKEEVQIVESTFGSSAIR